MALNRGISNIKGTNLKSLIRNKTAVQKRSKSLGVAFKAYGRESITKTLNPKPPKPSYLGPWTLVEPLEDD